MRLTPREKGILNLARLNGKITIDTFYKFFKTQKTRKETIERMLHFNIIREIRNGVFVLNKGAEELIDD